MPTPHDKLFFRTFRQVQQAISLLQFILPKDLAAQIDWSSLQVRPESLLDEQHRRRYEDLLFAVHLAGEPVHIYLLFEHKSGVDHFAPLQLLGSLTRFWEQERDQGATKLPPIIPILIQHGRLPWPGKTNIRNLLALPAVPPEALVSNLLSMPFLLDDLAGISPKELRQRALDQIAALTLFCLQHAREHGDFLHELKRWLQRSRQILTTKDGLRALRDVFVYTAEVVDVPPAQLDDFFAREVEPIISETMKSTYQQILDEGRQEGHQEGRQEGRQEGQADTVVKLLQARFGPLTDQQVALIREADQEQLDAWTIAILDAESPEALLGSPD